jgi:hypothetical protein
MTTSLAVVQSSTAYPLAAYGRVELFWDGVFGRPDVVDNALAPPSESLIFVPQTPTSRIFTVRLVCVSTSAALLTDSLTQLASLVDTPTAPVLFRRTVPSTSYATSGTPGVQTSEAYAYLVSGFRPVRPDGAGPNVANVALDFRMLSPYWYDTSSSAAVAL